MKRGIFLLFGLMFLFSSANVFSFLGDNQHDLGEVVAVSADHIEPITISSDFLKARNFPVMVFLRGFTLSSLLFGEDSANIEPLYGGLNIKDFTVHPKTHEHATITKPVFPRGNNLRIAKNGEIDLGHMVVNLKRNTKEDEIPDEIILNLTAKFVFDSVSRFGVYGRQDMIISPMGENNFLTDPSSGSFWSNRGYLRLSDIDGENAFLELYDGSLKTVSNFKLEEGKEKTLSLRGGPSFLDNKLRVKLKNILTPQTNAVLITDNGYELNRVNVIPGMVPFVGSSWTVKEISDYPASVIFLNEQGESVELTGKSSPTSNPCVDESHINEDYLVEELKQADFAKRKCTAISEYQQSLIYAEDIDKEEEIYLKIAETYKELGALIKSLEYYNKISLESKYYEERDLESIISEIEKMVEQEAPSVVLDGVVVFLEKAEKIEKTSYFSASMGLGSSDSPINDITSCYPSVEYDSSLYTSKGVEYGPNRGKDVDKIVLHYTVGDSVSSAVNSWVTSKSAGSHYIVDKSGKIFLVINEENVAWHAGCKKNEDPFCLMEDVNSNSIGIEIVNWGFKCEEHSNCNSNSCYNAKKECIAEYEDSWCTSELFTTDSCWETYTESQVESVKKLVSYLSLKYNIPIDKQHILEHSQITAQKSDPGPAWDQERFLYKVNNEVSNLKCEGLERDYTIGDILIKDQISTNNKKYNWIVEDILENKITLRTAPKSAYDGNYILSRGSNTVGGVKVYVSDINYEKAALLSILPGSGRAYGSSNFLVKIPVEKRAITWTPEEIDKKIDRASKTIENIDKALDSLGKMIKVWKGSCFVTYSTLVLKNLKTLAPRKAAITYYTDEVCKEDIEENPNRFGGLGIQEKVNNCLNYYETNTTKISDYMQGYSKGMDEQKKFLENFKNSGLNSPETKNYISSYFELTDEEKELFELVVEYNNYTKGANSGLIITNEKIKNMILEKETGDLNYQRHKDSLFNTEFLEKYKEIDSDIGSSSVIIGLIDTQKEVEEVIGIVSSKFEEKVERDIGHYSGNDLKKETLSALLESSPLNKITYKEEARVEGDNAVVYVDGERVELSIIKHGSIGLELEGDTFYVDTNGNVYAIGFNNEVVYNKIFNSPPTILLNDENKVWIFPYPFKKEGDFPYSDYANYVRVYFDEFGKRDGFSIVNVGSDGLVDIERKKDDQVILTPSQLKNPTNDFRNYRLIYENLEDHYKELEQKVLDKKENENKIKVNGEEFIINFASNAFDKILAQNSCQFYMSAKDCILMYNVCDPVMCPASRFDFGGKRKVSNVISTGIIGSMFLGMPNWQVFGGDMVVPPVCISGVHAGLDNLKTGFLGYQDCLQKAKVDGEYIGVCDEITGIYACEMLWREAISLTDVVGSTTDILGTALQKKFDLSKREGGEYFQNSKISDMWNQVKDATSHFTDQYATSAFTAFAQRSSEAFGTEVCKAAIHGNLPSAGDLLSQLTEPTSPSQFVAWYDKQSHSSANEELSTYRIYYHIYAGRDKKVRYNVYLKSPYGRVISALESQSVLSGPRLLEEGEYVDKKVIIVDSSEFNELCVDIDGASHCGFGKVTSSEAVNYMNDLIVEAEVKQNVTSYKECVPENPSLIPGTSGIIGEVVAPGPPGSTGLLESGVIKICSPTGDPDGSQERWKKVGTCGNDELGFWQGDCYVDTHSLDLKGYRGDSVEEFLNESIQEQIQAINQNEEESNKDLDDVLSKFGGKIDSGSVNQKTPQEIESIIFKLRNIIELSKANNPIYRAYSLIGDIYSNFNFKKPPSLSCNVLWTGTVNTGLNIRAGPGSTYKIMDSFSKGDSVAICEEKGKWLRIKDPGNNAWWVHEDYVDLTIITTTPTMVPGCTNPDAHNYNPSANIEDGSCVCGYDARAELPSSDEQVVGGLGAGSLTEMTKIEYKYDSSEVYSGKYVHKIKGWTYRIYKKLTLSQGGPSSDPDFVWTEWKAVDVPSIVPDSQEAVFNSLKDKRKNEGINYLKNKVGYEFCQKNPVGYIVQGVNPTTSSNVGCSIMWSGVVTADTLNIRQDSTSSSSKVGTLSKGDSVDVCEEKGKWLRIKDPGNNAWWVHEYYVKATQSTQSYDCNVLWTGTVNTGLNIRDGPGTTYDVMDSFSKGDFVEVCENQGDWLRIKDPGNNAWWVHEDYVDVQTQSQVISQTQPLDCVIGYKEHPSSSTVVEYRYNSISEEWERNGYCPESLPNVRTGWDSVKIDNAFECGEVQTNEGIYVPRYVGLNNKTGNYLASLDPIVGYTFERGLQYLVDSSNHRFEGAGPKRDYLVVNGESLLNCDTDFPYLDDCTSRFISVGDVMTYCDGSQLSMNCMIRYNEDQFLTPDWLFSFHRDYLGSENSFWYMKTEGNNKNREDFNKEWVFLDFDACELRSNVPYKYDPGADFELCTVLSGLNSMVLPDENKFERGVEEIVSHASLLDDELTVFYVEKNRGNQVYQAEGNELRVSSILNSCNFNNVAV